MDYLKDNWKTVLVALVVGGLIFWSFCPCNSTSCGVPAVKEEPVKELSDEEIEKLF